MDRQVLLLLLSVMRSLRGCSFRCLPAQAWHLSNVQAQQGRFLPVLSYLDILPTHNIIWTSTMPCSRAAITCSHHVGQLRLIPSFEQRRTGLQ